MRVSMIATVYNEIGSIRRFLESLDNQTEYPDEVVIVDGGSSDGTDVLLKEFADRAAYDFIFEVDTSCSREFTDGPIARGRNMAISIAKHDFIIGVDAGCELAPGFVGAMKSAFADGADFVCGAYDLLTPNNYQLKLRSSFVPNFDRVRFPGGFLPSSRSIGFCKRYWEYVGGYPEDSFAGEDTKFAKMVAEYAAKPVLAKDALVYWDSPANRAELKQKCIQYGFGDALFREAFPKYLFRFLLLLVPPVWLAFTLYKKRSLESWFIYF